jgi:Na+-driven multidrug efflux pump
MHLRLVHPGLEAAALTPSPPGQRLDARRTWRFFWPLALGGIMMSAGQPLVQAGLARLESPELVLAAYGLAFYVAVLLEAPIIMLLPAATALVEDEQSYRFTRNTMIVINAVLTLLAAVVALWTPLYDLVFQRLLSFPPDVSAAARPGLIGLLLWPAVIGVRRYYQGILVRFGRTVVVSLGSLARLTAMVGTLLTGIWLFPQHGILIGSATLMAGVVADMLVAVVAARRLLMRRVLPAESPDGRRAGRAAPAFLAFFLPLALTSALRVLGRPLMLSGIARSHEPLLAMAAFPVALSTMQLLSGYLQMTQQAAVALVKDGSSFVVVRRFVFAVGGACTGLLCLVAFSPLGNWYHGEVIGLDGTVLRLANAALRVLVVSPLLVAVQSYLQGLMIRAGRTMAVQLAALGNLILLVVAINALASHTALPGHLMAATVYPLALGAEVALLYWWCRPIERELALAAKAEARARLAGPEDEAGAR